MFISHHQDLDEDTTVNNAALSIIFRYLHGQQPGELFSHRSSAHVECDINGMDAMVEHLSFGYPDDMQRLLYPIQFDAIVALNRPARSIRRGDAQPKIPCDDHFRAA